MGTVGDGLGSIRLQIDKFGVNENHCKSWALEIATSGEQLPFRLLGCFAVVTRVRQVWLQELHDVSDVIGPPCGSRLSKQHTHCEGKWKFRSG